MVPCGVRCARTSQPEACAHVLLQLLRGWGRWIPTASITERGRPAEACGLGCGTLGKSRPLSGSVFPFIKL